MAKVRAGTLRHIWASGKSKHEEATVTTTSFNIIAWIRARRLRWVGHILRLPPRLNRSTGEKEPRLIKKTLKVIYDHQKPGDILMDVPSSLDKWQDLEKYASDRDV